MQNKIILTTRTKKIVHFTHLGYTLNNGYMTWTVLDEHYFCAKIRFDFLERFLENY